MSTPPDHPRSPEGVEQPDALPATPLPADAVRWVSPPVLVAVAEMASLMNFGGVIWLLLGIASIYYGQVSLAEFDPWVGYLFFGLAPVMGLAGVGLFTCRRKALPSAATALALLCLHWGVFQVQVHAEHAGQRLKDPVVGAATGLVIGGVIVLGMVGSYFRKSNWKERPPAPPRPPKPPREEELEAEPGWDEGDRR